MLKKLKVLASLADDNFSKIKKGWRSGYKKLDTLLPVIFENIAGSDGVYLRTNTPQYYEIVVEDSPSLFEVKNALKGLATKVAQNPFGDKQGVLISVEKEHSK